ncbi:hypothetical protein O6H91_03G046400 [Diphasiastrum complanatum]|uniref:Uncharacterized protein n=1 Tax=Diphasiastrum complanatum TaxID=34168 RepID=A0ACC2E5P6_DIPCM|nr:hypothetical protein O6H91_03G046400 [Diphasiastrum complanatum]
MYFVSDKGWAVFFMVCSLWCLGSWPVFFHILEHRGRLPQHTYIDYAFSTFVVAVAFALTLGQIGSGTPEEPNFTTQLSQENGPSVAIAMLGGIALCLGNIGMQYSLAFLGISLAEVVTASLAVVVGTTLNYFLDGGLNRAEMLFPGVGCFLIAVLLGSLCHASNAVDINSKLVTQSICNNSDEIERGAADHSMHFANVHVKLLDKNSCLKTSSNSEKGYEQSQCGTNSKTLQEELLETEENTVIAKGSLLQIEENRAIKVRGASVFIGLGLGFFTGACYGLFSPLFNIATNDQFHLLRPGIPHLVVYTTFFYFSIAFLLCGIAVSVYTIYNPFLGMPRSSLTAYLTDWKGRELAIMAGIMCGLGNGFQFMGGQAAGYAAADAVQALPLVGTFWGIMLFEEYHRSSRKTYLLLAAMLFMFTVAVILLIASARKREYEEP